MGSYRTPIKYKQENTVYVFLGDVSLAIRMTLSLNQKPQWYTNEVTCIADVYEIQYAKWEGKHNLVHTPDSNRTHALVQFGTRESYYPDSIALVNMVINAIDDFETPDIPEFQDMAPLDVIRITRCPVPQSLHMSWQVWQGISTFKIAAWSEESGITIDAGARKRAESEPNYMDDVFHAWSNIT